MLPTPPTIIDYSGMHFMIMDAPTDTNAPLYLEEMRSQNVRNVVRVCDPTYSTDIFNKSGIKVHDWSFPDGDAPPSSVLNNWLGLVNSIFVSNKEVKERIAVHCVAGLGRAPVLVAVAMIERGMDPMDAVEYIRQRRRGAINAKQLKFLEGYKKGGCLVM